MRMPGHAAATELDRGPDGGSTNMALLRSWDLGKKCHLLTSVVTGMAGEGRKPVSPCRAKGYSIGCE